MGMDLVGTALSYNWWSWWHLLELLSQWGVNMEEFECFNNDGNLISGTTCLAVADAIEAHLHEVDQGTRSWLEPQIEQWRNCGGCLQY